jgi:hypothetical protein
MMLAVGMLAACNDLRDFRGTWQGDRVGDAPVLRVGPGESATLSVDDIDAHGIHGRVSVPGLVQDAEVTSIPGAEADALANLTFAGSPLRVYLAFVAVTDGGGDAMLMLALFDATRIEARLLRGGTKPLYAIFALRVAGSPP